MSSKQFLPVAPPHPPGLNQQRWGPELPGWHLATPCIIQTCVCQHRLQASFPGTVWPLHFSAELFCPTAMLRTYIRGLLSHSQGRTRLSLCLVYPLQSLCPSPIFLPLPFSRLSGFDGPKDHASGRLTYQGMESSPLTAAMQTLQHSARRAASHPALPLCGLGPHSL